MRLVGYVRVSTAEQASEGHSLGAQERAIGAWCEAMGHELVAVYSDEGVSAKDLNRPRLAAALEAIDTCDGLVVVKLDRLTRSGRDFYELVERFEAASKALVSVRDSLDTTTPSGRLVANIMVAVSQWEREAIAERVRDGMAEAKRKGVHVGRPRMSYDAEVLMAARRCRMGGLSLELTAHHLSTTFGEPYTIGRVRRMLA
jgi:site-specific DNA recombinase